MVGWCSMGTWLMTHVISVTTDIIPTINSPRKDFTSVASPLMRHGPMLRQQSGSGGPGGLVVIPIPATRRLARVWAGEMWPIYGELSQDKCGFASKNRDLNNNSWDSTWANKWTNWWILPRRTNVLDLFLKHQDFFGTHMSKYVDFCNQFWRSTKGYFWKSTWWNLLYCNLGYFLWFYSWYTDVYHVGTNTHQQNMNIWCLPGSNVHVGRGSSMFLWPTS